MITSVRVPYSYLLQLPKVSRRNGLPHYICPSGHSSCVIHTYRHHDPTVETLTVGWNPSSRSMAGRRASRGPSKVRSSPYTGAQGAPVPFFGSRSGGWDWPCEPRRALVWPCRERIGGPDGKDVLLRYLQDGDSGGCLAAAGPWLRRPAAPGRPPGGWGCPRKTGRGSPPRPAGGPAH